MATKKAPAKTGAPVVKKATITPAEKAASAKKMTKAEWVRFAAEKLGLTTKQPAAFTESLAATATQESKKNGKFTIPGVGKLIKAQRAARIGRNPQTGESMKIKAKTVVKSPIAKAAKGAIAPTKEPDPQDGTSWSVGGFLGIFPLNPSPTRDPTPRSGDRPRRANN